MRIAPSPDVQKKIQNKQRVFDCIIVGGGPAGLGAALYLRRYRRNILVINSGRPRASRIGKIHNLLGCPPGISGKMLLANLIAQLRDLKTKFIRGEASVRPITQKGTDLFEVLVHGKKLLSHKVILATGTLDEEPDVSNYNNLCAENVIAYCPVCDGNDFCDQPIGLLARNAQGIRKLKFISTFTNKITLVLLEGARLSPRQLQLIKSLNVDLRRGNLEKLSPVHSPLGVRIYLENQEPIFVRVLYIALGTRMRDSAFQNIKQLKRTRDGFLRVSAHQETSVRGLYAVGDCVNDLSQISVAAGHAAVAATHVHNRLLRDGL
jgi:thioredoxin reductase (NADPH)